jgi:16S rRNA (uracil1498-N3)-methyltransferase
MTSRYFSETAIESDSATLAGAEAHHLARVMRAQIGDVVILFDGSGAEFLARIERITKSAVEFCIEERRDVDRELTFRLTLAVALPKGDRQRWLVEKAVELGVSRLIPVKTTRGVADGRAAIDRLRRAVIEASKQCGRNRLMEIASPRDWSDVVVAPGERKCTRLIAHPAESTCPNALETSTNQEIDEVIIAVGPEGGWTEQEVALAHDNGWQFVDLGPRILRVETAAIALASAIVLRRSQ